MAGQLRHTMFSGIYYQYLQSDKIYLERPDFHNWDTPTIAFGFAVVRT